jgi:hypothetical protein
MGPRIINVFRSKGPVLRYMPLNAISSAAISRIRARPDVLRNPAAEQAQAVLEAVDRCRTHLDQAFDDPRSRRKVHETATSRWKLCGNRPRGDQTVTFVSGPRCGRDHGQDADLGWPYAIGVWYKKCLTVWRQAGAASHNVADHPKAPVQNAQRSAGGTRRFIENFVARERVSYLGEA